MKRNINKDVKCIKSEGRANLSIGGIYNAAKEDREKGLIGIYHPRHLNWYPIKWFVDKTTKRDIDKKIICIETGNQTDITVGKEYHAIRIDEERGIIAIKDELDDPVYAYWYPLDWFEDANPETSEK